jgi:hypothetical protein
MAYNKHNIQYILPKSGDQKEIEEKSNSQFDSESQLDLQLLMGKKSAEHRREFLLCS